MSRKFLLAGVLSLSAATAATVGSQPWTWLASSSKAQPQQAAIATSQAQKLVTPAPVANQAGKEQLVYSVRHSKYGKIGTYTNTVERHGDTTDITTNGKLAVSVLGINMYRQDISRHETWRGNRIVDFHGVTTENGKSVALEGKAEGDHFALTTPNGKTTAPADVRLANPWSRQAIVGDMMLTPDQGKLEPISMGGKEQATLTIGQRQVRTEHIKVQRGEGGGRYEVWLDEKGTPVQFSVVGNDTVTFTLTG